MAVALRLDEAAHLINAVRGESRTLHDIFPKVEKAKYSQWSIPMMYEKFGVRYRDYLVNLLEVTKIRNACQLSVARSVNGSNLLREWTKDLIALSMGCIYCQELTTSLFLKALEMGRPIVRVTIGSPSKPEGYAFLLSGESQRIVEAYVQNENIETFVEKLRNCVVIDPYLNAVFPVEEFNSSAVSKYLRSTGFGTVISMEYLPPDKSSQEQARAILFLAEKITPLAQEILHSKGNMNARIATLEGLVRNALVRFPIALS